VERESGGGPASSPKKAWKNRCAVAGSDTVAAIAGPLEQRIRLSRAGGEERQELLDRDVEGEGREEDVDRPPWLTQKDGTTDRQADDRRLPVRIGSGCSRHWQFTAFAVPASLC
jgi:hypothetical protein